MKDQAFGIEIELTGITREKAAAVIAGYFGTDSRYDGGTYSQYSVADGEGRRWKVARDSSIKAERKVGDAVIEAGDDYKVEIISPKCQYEDIETIQEIVRKLRKAGAMANRSCGIHVHVDASAHNAKTLRNLVNMMASKEDLIYKALDVDEARMERYCKKVDVRLLEDINRVKPDTLGRLGDVWYGPYTRERRDQHYHSSRYHGLNLHSVFTKGTVEFRLFNSTTHAGKIKAYIQFCLAVSHQALTQKTALPRKTQTTNDKYTFRTWLLRLGLIGDEFKTARFHLLANLEGNAAWRNAAWRNAA